MLTKRHVYPFDDKDMLGTEIGTESDDDIVGEEYTYYADLSELSGGDVCHWINDNVYGCDEIMRSTGYDCSLTVVTDAGAGVTFLSKEVDSIPEYILKYLCSLIESGWDKMLKSAKEGDYLDSFLAEVKEVYSSLCGGAWLIVDGTKDDVIKIGVDVCGQSDYCESFFMSYSPEGFWGGKVDRIFKPLPKIVEQVLKDYNGITINKVCLWYLCAVDVPHPYEKAKSYPKKFFKGILRDFSNMFHRYGGLNKDAYTVALIICEDRDESNIREIIANYGCEE